MTVTDQQILGLPAHSILWHIPPFTLLKNTTVKVFEEEFHFIQKKPQTKPTAGKMFLTLGLSTQPYSSWKKSKIARWLCCKCFTTMGLSLSVLKVAVTLL